MTFSGCSAGNVDPKTDNLKPEYYEAFCDYLIDVCIYYKNEYGIEFKTLEPFNESTSAYWNYLGSQEGCHFDAETQVEIIRILYPKLLASGLKTVISASDETNLESSIEVLKKYMEAGDIIEKIGQFNTHTYNGSNAERKELFELVTSTGKEFWQSETGPQGLPRRAAGLENNLLLAQKMFDDLKIMKPQAWLDWQLMEENNDVWGLIRCDFKTENYELIKNLFVRMQITRFFQQGYTFIETNNESVLAAVDPENSEIVIAVNNPENMSQDFSLNLNAFPANLNHISCYRTSKSENCQLLDPILVEDKNLNYEAPAMSITTFVFKL
jgi:O-glycosyl hydrolase